MAVYLVYINRPNPDAAWDMAEVVKMTRQDAPEAALAHALVGSGVDSVQDFAIELLESDPRCWCAHGPTDAS